MPSNNKRTGYTIPCDNCGKEFYITQYRYKHNKTHCCSVKCAFELKTKQALTVRACEYCGEEFSCRATLPKRFCSVQCQHEWQKTNVGERNPKYQRTMVPCECCGQQIPVQDYKLSDGRHHFCSIACRRRWFAEVWSQQEWWIEESRRRGARTCASIVGKTMTKPQRIVNAMLDDLGISFTNEETFTYYSIDNYLPEHKMAIEVMGDYWHSSPIKYDLDQLTDYQKRVIGRDKAKRTYLRNQFGVPVLYLWESDLYTSANMCGLLIQKYLELGGVLENYHSFNYHINDSGKLCLNNEIVIPFQELYTKGA